MATDKTVKVTLIGDTSRYRKDMGDAATATSKLGRDMEGIDAKARGMGASAGKASGALKGMAIAGAAVAGTALVSFLGDAVKAAGDLEQSVGGVEAVFGSSADKINAFGKEAAENVGLARNEFNELITVTGAMLKNKGLEDFADKSLDLVKIGADLSATYGGSAKEAVEALNAAMRGESDPIERYGISLNETAVNAELAAKGLRGLTGQALEQAKAQARIDIITRQSADALGKFAAEADTLQGQQQRLNAQWEDAKAELGQSLLPALTSITQAMRGGVDAVVAAVQAWEKVPGPVKAAVGAFVAFRLVQGPLGKGIGTVRDRLVAIREEMALQKALAGGITGGYQRLGDEMVTTSKKVGTFRAGVASVSKSMGGMRGAGSALMGLVGGPWGLAITGLTLAITGYFQAQENARKAAEEFADTLDKTTGKFTEQSRELARNKFFKDFAQEDYSKVSDSLEKAGVGLGSMIAAYEKGGPAIDDFKAKFDAWRASADAMSFTNQGVNVEALGNSYAALGRDIDRSREIAEVNKRAQEDTAKAVGETGDAAKDAKPPVDRYAGALKKIKEEAEKGRDRNKELAKAMLAVKAAAGDADAAEVAYQQSLDDATAALKENGRTLDINTQKGRDNWTALKDVADNANATAEANLKNGESVKSVNGELDKARDAFIRVAEKMGASKTKAKEMADQYVLTKGDVNRLRYSIDEIPKEKVTKLTVEDDAAKKRVKELQTLLTGDWLKDKTVRITTIYEELGSTAARLAAQSRDSRRSRVVTGDFNAAGDVKNAHTAQIGNGGAIRIWNEPETQGESYIPHANDWRRPRAKSILEETARILGAKGIQWNAAGAVYRPATVGLPVRSTPDLVAASVPSGNTFQINAIDPAEIEQRIIDRLNWEAVK